MSITPLYSTRATATGGRDGTADTEDGTLSVKLVTPKELGGAGGEGTNPEQLFATGYAACFMSALKLVAGKQKVALTDDASATAEVGIGKDGAGFGLVVTLSVSLPGVDAETADALLEKAHEVCPYSNAIRGNVEVTLNRA
ncbi:organic hydroperoxide resistance protein [Pseudooceanicola algae]|uniref:Organic hydroperoxide resistance protein OhrB n=1 Tax=Pseudooceanicola algae TaxID=1537215 RepID=A0A418SFC5_9RHOB|nr:organic hydroperoxide resistance protein [Pseudooceanicola algae]QPM89202.1 Organic hydroperoxide resistance protein OhrB [Pseudooceanicola algae]